LTQSLHQSPSMFFTMLTDDTPELKNAPLIQDPHQDYYHCHVCFFFSIFLILHLFRLTVTPDLYVVSFTVKNSRNCNLNLRVILFWQFLSCSPFSAKMLLQQDLRGRCMGLVIDVAIMVLKIQSGL
jgi:hypothetical protein